MSISQEYKHIFENEIIIQNKSIICEYSPVKGLYEYKPYSHNCSVCCGKICYGLCYTSLGELMRKNLVFYCYGEEEIVKNYRNKFFYDLEKSAKYAYRNRVPKRQPTSRAMARTHLVFLYQVAIAQTANVHAETSRAEGGLRSDSHNHAKAVPHRQRGRTVSWR